MLSRRLAKLETVQQAACQEFHDASVRELGRTMDPEHVQMVQDWLRQHLGGLNVRIALPNESVYATLTRLQPPALVRAVWLLLDEHARNGTPLSLAPNVAEVYLSDPDAWPTNPCEGCGYLLPTKSTVRPPGRFHHIGWYMGCCPVCGLDNQMEEEQAGV